MPNRAYKEPMGTYERFIVVSGPFLLALDISYLHHRAEGIDSGSFWLVGEAA